MTQRTIKKVKYGNTERRSFAQINEVCEMPYLIEVQKNSYNDFLKNGIGEVFEDFSPIRDFSNKMELYFLDHQLEMTPKYSERECKDRDATYAVPLRVTVRLVNKETGSVTEQKVFMGDLPLMTPNGSFIINGAERVVVSQLVRSPGVYFNFLKDIKTGVNFYGATNIPSRGAWLEFQEDDKGILWVHVDRQRKVHASVLLRALSAVSAGEFEDKTPILEYFKDKDFSADEALAALFAQEPLILSTLDKDPNKTAEEGLKELNRKLRPGEIPNIDSIKLYLRGLFFDKRKYDLSRVGRYKFNKKLALSARITGLIAHENVVDANGVVHVKAGEKISEETAVKIQNAGINEVSVRASCERGFHVVTGNRHVDLAGYVTLTKDEKKETELPDRVYYPALKAILDESKGKKDVVKALLRERAEQLNVKHILIDDIIATINYVTGLRYGIGSVDNIDHLGNRRVRSVGELLQNQFRIGIARLERVVRERMQIQTDAEPPTPQNLINIRPVTSAIKEFFGSSQLSQFMDESNPIAELTHKRKLSALGPGGLNRERATFEVRDVHYSHYSRMCPIETPEGQNIGLINSLSSYAKINSYGFIEAPYRRVDKVKKVVTGEVHYLAADEEDRYVLAQANEPLDAKGWFVNERIMARDSEEIAEYSRDDIDYVDVSPRQMISVATALIPFLENDDTNRALMGSNMQRQAVPLLKPEAPIVGTGIEHKIAYDSGVMVVARKSGVVTYVDADRIIVAEDENGEAMPENAEIIENFKRTIGKKEQRAEYTLLKFIGTNQGTCINQKPLVQKGDKVRAGQVIADGHSTQNAELALGRNILVGFMSWEGYNYEDAILISEKIVKDDVFTSIHIEEHELEARDTKLGEEEITRDIPNVGEDALKNLNEDGIVRIGAELESGDILVGKVTPKGETELTPEERLLRAIFGEKAREVRDTSLRVPHGEGGIVVDVKVFTRANKDEMSPGVNKLVRVYIAQKRKISVGDKMAGRHGNKGVISRILPQEDMPFMADGTPLEIVLNPLGVPSRMNIGQVLEVHLGLVAKAWGWKVASPVFDGALESDIEKLLHENGFTAPDGGVDGKVQMYDGRTGEPFENRSTVGYMYMIKLIHLVDDKIHARSTGPYSLVTQQPLGGKAQFGGQRFGEMEVWALYAYGAANILQEIMTVKSDDVVGRVKTYESIVKGGNNNEPGVPESFKVLIKELQALALDVKVLNEDKQEIGIRELIEDERDELGDRSDKKKHYVGGNLDIEDEIDIAQNIFADDLLEDDADLGENSLFGEDDFDIGDDPFGDTLIDEDELTEDDGLFDADSDAEALIDESDDESDDELE
ncbi:MAG: DNA-directed RNA polymerase subunit beta [Clostridiales bacterium]|jgi:DNA-directed RNA polymerase subunit beta|nr:DNA-directed RNA polymerase subunit beta [Clostridiales bacterium]